MGGGSPGLVPIQPLDYNGTALVSARVAYKATVMQKLPQFRAKANLRVVNGKRENQNRFDENSFFFGHVEKSSGIGIILDTPLAFMSGSVQFFCVVDGEVLLLFIRRGRAQIAGS